MPCFLIKTGNSTDADYLIVGTNTCLEGTPQNLDNVIHMTITCKLNSEDNTVNINDNGKELCFTATPGTNNLSCYVHCQANQTYVSEFHYNWTATMTHESQITTILPSSTKTNQVKSTNTPIVVLTQPPVTNGEISHNVIVIIVVTSLHAILIMILM